MVNRFQFFTMVLQIQSLSKYSLHVLYSLSRPEFTHRFQNVEKVCLGDLKIRGSLQRETSFIIQGRGWGLNYGKNILYILFCDIYNPPHVKDIMLYYQPFYSFTRYIFIKLTYVKVLLRLHVGGFMN